LQLKGEHLHSRYNPQAEAERYINALNINDNIECFILIEPGMGYIVPALQARYKNSKIIALHIDIFPPAGIPALCVKDSIEMPLEAASIVQAFLEKEAAETDASNIRIIEWRPSMNFYGKDYVFLLSCVVEFIKRLDAGQRTVSVFGKRWIRNFFKNLGLINEALLYRETDIPVIITGCGPSLEKTLPFIRNLQDQCIILASSSSLMALQNNGINADIIIATDGGSWALMHIYHYFRNNYFTNNGGYGFAVNLCAALPSQCKGPFLILNDGSFWQSIVLSGLALPSIIIPQKGTVTASAVELALILSTGNIFLAGMDLSINDIRTHVRPYGFDYLFTESASRFSPVYSQSFTRSHLMKEGGSLKIYAGWFRNRLSTWPKRIFSLDSHDIFKNYIPELTGKKKKNIFKPEKIQPDNFSQKAVNSLIYALENPEYEEKIRNELIPLIFPKEKNITKENLIKTLKEFYE
jgi:hypothetical protein